MSADISQSQSQRLNNGLYDEGIIKYNCHWVQDKSNILLPNDPLIIARDQLFELGLIGVDQNGISYGNISRLHGEQFIISGTQTGEIARSEPKHYSLVSDFDIQQNQLSCRGIFQASSESLTHAALYTLSPAILSVVHIHSSNLWERYLNTLPTTQEQITYGTPEMANEIQRLFFEDELIQKQILVMAGHHGGLVSFGESPEAAVRLITEL